MSKQNFEKWLADGPDSMSHEDVKAALDWRDANRHEAFSARQEYETHRALEERRELLVETARRQGADASEATRLAQRLMDEEREQSIREADETTRHATARRVHKNF
jgi:hypothetical protein